MTDSPGKTDPHYLRFARALALVGVLGGGASGCCPLVPDSVACEHCACPWQTRSASQPLMCSTIQRQGACCPVPVPVVGPLSPPELSS